MRRPVELPRAYRLMNHGPTVLVSAAHEGRRNVMAAAWAMPLDFDPPKVCVVLDKSTFTRALIEANGGEFALSIPCRAQADLTATVGNTSGREMLEANGQDKFAHFRIGHFAGTATAAPLVEGCVGWLECRVIDEPQHQQRYDLFVAEVLAAQADDRVFSEGRWHFGPGDDALRTIHHVAGGAFLCAGEAVQGRLPGA